MRNRYIPMRKLVCMYVQTNAANLGGGGTVGETKPRFSKPTPYFVTLAR